MVTSVMALGWAGWMAKWAAKMQNALRMRIPYFGRCCWNKAYPGNEECFKMQAVLAQVPGPRSRITVSYQ